ncbi:MAG TPA: NAD-dependent epimerase/dehydratase family protein [Longimicrobiales bacterium]|nr:NAD-dependent epimerase/dehydratase family protein [Longimicrobiales bacterium]
MTGATGFVGSHLVEALRPRVHSLRAVVRPTSDVRLLEAAGAERVVADLCDTAALTEALAGVDVVVHLAAATRARDAEAYRRVNVEGTRAIVTAALEAAPRPRRFVYVSSMAAAGPSTARAVRADDTPRPLTTYGQTKLGGEAVALAAAPRLEVLVLRPPAVYGPRDRDLLPFFRLATRGILPVAGDPGRKLQLIHVRDLAQAIVRAVEAPDARGIYHVADPRAYTWGEVSSLIARAVGRRGRSVPVPAGLLRAAALVSEGLAALRGRASIFNREKVVELLAPGWECDPGRAAEELGFETDIGLERGLAETAAWYRAQGWI